MNTPENIGFISTRFAGTDGVSLESAKWAEVLWRDRHVSYWYGGMLDREPGVSMCIPEAFFGHSENAWINDQLWRRTKRDRIASTRIRDLAEYLKSTLYDFTAQFDIDILVIQNALTIPMHIPLGIAITEYLLETGMPAIAHHHDFYWERQRFQVSAVNDYLEMAFPPRIPRLQHVVINRAAHDQLGWRKGLSSLLIPNVLDFENPPGPLDDYASDVREAMGVTPEQLLVLQPTRVVPRKGIEHAVHLLRCMKDLPCKLVVSHSIGDEGLEYYQQISELAQDEGIEFVVFGDRVAERRQLDGEGSKIYVIEDLYPHADLVTFPSLYEGFGNALLEAIYFRRPVVTGRYSVYESDIETKGIELPTIDGFIGRKLVQRTRRLLEDHAYRDALVEKNYEIARRYFSYGVLHRALRTLIDNARQETE